MEIAKRTVESKKIRELEEKIKEKDEIIARKDREIKETKFSLADILFKIITINDANDSGQPDVKKRKINEICTNTRYELLVDELKIIENRTTTTDQSNK